MPDGYAQKRSKKRSASPAQAHPKPAEPATTGIDMREEPSPVEIPQERTLKPKLKKTKKVVIVPAPPPPPGPDPVPEYPKR